MKHIGIVACSAEGAALCYQTICREALTLVGKNDHPRVTLDSIPMARWLPAFDARDYAGVAAFMLESARLLREVPPPQQPEPLTERETEVLRQLAQGKSNREIATALVIAEKTARTHVSNILAKLGVTSRTQAVARARQLQLL